MFFFVQNELMLTISIYLMLPAYKIKFVVSLYVSNVIEMFYLCFENNENIFSAP